MSVLQDVLIFMPAAVAVYLAAYAALGWCFPTTLRFAWWQVLNALYSFKTHHRERVPRSGACILVCNHVSYIDWMVLWFASPRRLRIVLYSGYYKNPILSFFLSFLRHRTIRVDNRKPGLEGMEDAVRAILAALNAGEAVLLFPEGRLTRNGQMRPFSRGLELIVREAAVPVAVVPVCTSGLWGSFFSHKGGRILRKWPGGLRRRVCVWFGEPIVKPVKAPELRAAVAECMADLAIAESGRDVLVPNWFLRTASRWRNIFRPAFVDAASTPERTLKMGQGFVAAWCLAAWLKPRLKPGTDAVNAVGIWLPTGLGSMLANAAMAFLRRPTVNLNYTAGTDAVRSACQQAGLTTVITAKRFTAKMPLDLPPHVEIIHLEEALAGITKVMKLWRFIALLLLPAWLLERIIGLHHLKPDDLITIVFSSGSTGAPKGVMLSHRNVASNSHAFDLGVDLRRGDIMLANLPFFHSFGYTVCLWAPLGVGMKAVYHPDPRAAQEVGELCRRHRCTIQLGTATFVRFYLRRCQPGDFSSLRLFICGAERLPIKLQEEFLAKFGVELLEGYGCTETSPVVCTNLHDVVVSGLTQVAHRRGTVGQPIPGVVAKAFHPDTLAAVPHGKEGVLGVKGPNVMLGYLHQPDKTHSVIIKGWYITGDRGLIEPDGFIRITGRLTRFAKIAGEMVPLERVEDELQELSGHSERVVAVAAVPDEKRGERLMVLHTDAVNALLLELLQKLASRGLPNLWIPDRRDCRRIDAFPTLGSGKLDLKALDEMARRLSSVG